MTYIYNYSLSKSNFLPRTVWCSHEIEYSQHQMRKKPTLFFYWIEKEKNESISYVFVFILLLRSFKYKLRTFKSLFFHKSFDKQRQNNLDFHKSFIFSTSTIWQIFAFNRLPNSFFVWFCCTLHVSFEWNEPLKNVNPMRWWIFYSEQIYTS